MDKKRMVLNLLVIGLAAVALSGCTLIVKGENSTKYYGIDEERGSQLLSQVEGNQQETQAPEIVPATPAPSHLK